MLFTHQPGNRLLLAVLLAAAATAVATILANATTAYAESDDERGDGIRLMIRVLESARADVAEKIDRLQEEEGVPVPAEVDLLYSKGLAEYEAAGSSLDGGDAAAAKAHALNAMNLFKEATDMLADLEEEEEDEDERKGELAEELDEDIALLEREAVRLRSLAGLNNASALDASFASYDRAVGASKGALADGDLEESGEKLLLAREILAGIKDDILSAADSDRGEKAKEFAYRTAVRLGEIVTKTKNDVHLSDLESAVRELEDTISWLQANAADADGIIEVADEGSRLHAIIDSYNSKRIERFDDEYLSIERDVAELQLDASELDITIETSDIDDLLDAVRQQAQEGRSERAGIELDRLDSLLDKIEDVVKDVSSIGRDIAKAKKVAADLKSGVSGSGSGALERIEQAELLLEEAEAVVSESSGGAVITEATLLMVLFQLEQAEDMVDEAEDILEDVGKGEDSDSGEELDDVMEEIGKLEAMAARIKNEAERGGNSDALEDANRAIFLINLARTSALQQDFEKAESYLEDAEDRLEDSEEELEEEDEEREDDESGNGGRREDDEEQGQDAEENDDEDDNSGSGSSGGDDESQDDGGDRDGAEENDDEDDNSGSGSGSDDEEEDDDSGKGRGGSGNSG